MSPEAKLASFPYGRARLQSHRLLAACAVAICLMTSSMTAAIARPLKLIAFGDSLSAGYMLPDAAAFPNVLEKALRADGFDVSVVNAGVSGDTATGGAARLAWTLGDGADGVILELGANDMLRGTDPAVTEAALDGMLATLQARGIKVLLAGMLATPSLGRDYVQKFEAIYPHLAKKYDVPLYPFFLEGIATEPGLKLADGLHPNPAGVEVIVKNILPSVETLLRGLQASTKASATP
jgi:acyl-CoA thioesterase-1